MILKIRNILISTSKLYLQSYFYVLPFLLIYAMLQYAIDKWLPIQKNIINIHFLQNAMAQLIIYILFFCFIIYGLSLKDNLQPFSYLKILVTGLKRSIQMFLGYLLGTLITMFVVVGASLALVLTTLLPIVLASFVQKYATLFVMLKDLIYSFVIDLFQGFQFGFLSIFSFSPMYLMNLIHNLKTNELGMVEVVIIFVCLTIVLYYFVMGVLIVNKNYPARNAIVHSVRLVRGHWLLTFILVVIWAIVVGGLGCGLDYLAVNYAKPILSILTFSLAPALMVKYCSYLENAHHLKK